MRDTTARRHIIAQPLTALTPHTADDVIRVNGRAVAHDGEAWTWADSGEALDFDTCERYGLDGTGRAY